MKCYAVTKFGIRAGSLFGSKYSRPVITLWFLELGSLFLFVHSKAKPIHLVTEWRRSAIKAGAESCKLTEDYFSCEEDEWSAWSKWTYTNIDFILSCVLVLEHACNPSTSCIYVLEKRSRSRFVSWSALHPQQNHPPCYLNRNIVLHLCISLSPAMLLDFPKLFTMGVHTINAESTDDTVSYYSSYFFKLSNPRHHLFKRSLLQDTLPQSSTWFRLRMEALV